jgi:hypothetical protein
MKKLTSMVKYNLEIFGQQTSSEEFMEMSIERSWLLNRTIQKSDCIGEKSIFEGFEEINGLISHRGNLIPDECFGLTRIEELVSWNLILK